MDVTKQNDQVIENKLASKIDALNEDRVICSSCESTNLEVYSKNDHLFMLCLDFGRKELIN